MSHAVYRYRYTIVPLHVTGSGICFLRNKHFAVTVLPHASINDGGIQGSTASNGQDTVTGPTFAGTFNKASAVGHRIGIPPDLRYGERHHTLSVSVYYGSLARHRDLDKDLYNQLKRRLY